MSRSQVSRRIFLQAVSGLLLAAGPMALRAQTADKITLGALRFTSSGPVFLALERGYFKAEGLDAEIAYFQDAPSVATATATGDLTFGITALSAAFYNLASQGKVKIIAGQAQEKQGYVGTLILVNRQAYEAGHQTLATLFDQPFGLTQLGSPSHYMLGQLVGDADLAMETVNIQTFQTFPNLIGALKSGGVSWAIIAPPIASDLIDAGAVKSIGPYSDHGSFQFGGVFAASALLESNPDLARRFLRAYRQGLSDYSQIVTDPGSDAARQAAGIVAQYVYPDMDPNQAAGKVLTSAFYIDPTGQLDLDDIARQIAWYASNGLVKTAPAVQDIVALDLLE